jgi:Holliday junction resolvase
MSIYERELKGILQADLKTLNEVTRACDLATKKSFFKILRKPFIVLRAAGSFGVDLVAIRQDIAFPIEVKSIKEKKFHFSNTTRLKLQADWLRKLCISAGVFPLYAFRLKRVRNNDPWRIFTFKLAVNNEIYEQIPKLRLTKAGNYVINWDDGLELHKLLEILCK